VKRWTDEASTPSLLNRLHLVRRCRRPAGTAEVTDLPSRPDRTLELMDLPSRSTLSTPTRCEVVQWLSPPSLAMSTLQLVPAVFAIWW
jgi:hypothetical protein